MIADDEVSGAGKAATRRTYRSSATRSSRSKSTFYFSIAVLVLVDIIQSGYQRKLTVGRTQSHPEAGASAPS